MFNTNMHPSSFQNKVPPQIERRTIDSVEFERSIPIDLKTAPRKNYNLYLEDKDYTKTASGSTSGDYSSTALSNIISGTPLSRVFFSGSNIDNLQNLVRMQVFIDSGGVFDTSGRPNPKTGHVIGRQSDTQMVIFMRYIYMSYCTFPVNCTEKIIQDEVNRLNRLVVIEAVPNILEHVEAHLGYLRDASRIPDPIARSLATTNAGTKQHRSITKVLGAEF
jgi:hypothetical protein